MGTKCISPSSSSVQWNHQRIKPQLQIQWFYPPSPFIHNTHRRLQYDDASVCSSSWGSQKRTRSLFLRDQKSADLVRSRRRRNTNHGIGGPTSSNDDDDDGGGNGTIAGAVAMIIGTSIGSGMLALPQRTSPAGLLPTSISMIICWCFLLFEALLLVEVNVNIRKRKTKTDANELEVISIRTMAKETLGEFGGALATIAYIFLGYTSMVAYCSKSGEILVSLVNLPASASGAFFTLLFTLLIVVGGTHATDHVNQWLTTCMIGLLLAIEVLAVAFGGLAESGSSGDWGEVPPAIPVMIFSLVYHDIVPVICAYLEGDVTRIRTSVILGSLVPLVALLVWDAIVLGLSSSLPDQNIDPIELLMRVKWSGMPFMAGAFSLLAVGTSMIGTLLGFSEFFKEQLNLYIIPLSKTLQSSKLQLGMRRLWGRNRLISCAAMVLAVGPSLFLSTKFPDAFSAATDIAGGYCMTMLFGVLPPAMAWAMHEKTDGFADQMLLSKLTPALIGVGVFASGIVLEQILQDFPVLNP